MPKQKLRNMLLDDLRGVLRGDLNTDPVILGTYATDAGVWEVYPLAVVAPRDVIDLSAVTKYAAEQSIEIHPRGAGLGVSGESLGGGIVIDCSRHLRRIIGFENDQITVESGTTIGEVQNFLCQIGRRLVAVGPESENFTIGGLINGHHRHTVPAEGRVEDQIVSARVVLGDGSIQELSSQRLPSEYEEANNAETTTSDAVFARILRIANWHNESNALSPLLHKAALPYEKLIDRSSKLFHPQKLLCGSRGTLASLLEATLRTERIRKWNLRVTVGFDIPERAAESALALSNKENLESVEIFDWRRIAMACESEGSLKHFFPEPTPVSLCIHFSSDDEQTMRAVDQELAMHAFRRCIYFRSEIRSDTARHPLSTMRKLSRMALSRRNGAPLPRPVFEAVCVPPAEVPGILSQIALASQMARLHLSLSIAPLTGMIQADPLVEPGQPLPEQQIVNWLDAIAEATYRSGGYIWGAESWFRRIRSSALTRQYARIFPTWREIKSSFDINGIVNPKAIPGEPRVDLKLKQTSIAASLIPEKKDWEAKVFTGSLLGSRQEESESTIDRYPNLPILTPELKWPETAGPQLSASACNSCGACRTLESGSRMCPSFRGDRTESSSPRALAGLIREVTSGSMDPMYWGSERLKSAAEACFHCQMCKSECQGGVDISALMIEAKAAAVQNYGLPPKDFWLARVDMLAGMASFFPVIANSILSHGRSRWVLEKVTGLSRYRRLPRVRRWSFLHRAEARGWSKPRPQMTGPRVALFLDILTNHFDQDLAETTVEYLKWAGVNVYIPARQRSSGMPALVVGDLDRARELVRSNLRVLGNAVRDGYTIVCVEPTSAMVLRTFYPRLTDDLDAQLVADNTLELGQYLAGMNEREMLPASNQALYGRIGYHQPCHLRAMNVGTPGLDLVRRVPGVDVEFIDRGCSGIAGPFGFARSNFRKSLRIGHQLRSRLKDDDIDVGMTECLSCRMQMEQGITKRAHHPVEILAMAAGLRPELRLNWNEPKPRNVIT